MNPLQGLCDSNLSFLITLSHDGAGAGAGGLVVGVGVGVSVTEGAGAILGGGPAGTNRLGKAVHTRRS
jgi:hypothetical protein